MAEGGSRGLPVSSDALDRAASPAVVRAAAELRRAGSRSRRSPPARPHQPRSGSGPPSRRPPCFPPRQPGSRRPSRPRNYRWAW
ncbi:hypothetical protein [Ornithinimicrobium kibberense]|uniref:hypothetical protein n=1 Tax=Ornithinimicrobium kibberense TaxID=282060 RepID=UPI00361AD9C3